MYGGDGVKLDCPASLLKGSIAPHPWWQAYHSLSERITVTGCMAHARRRFDEALTHERTAERDDCIPGDGPGRDAL